MDNMREPELKPHSYDGIQEYDNPLPTWWLMTFFITIIFGFHYWIHFEFGGGQTQEQELRADMAVIEEHRAKAPKPVESEDELRAALSQDAVVNEGAAIFAGKCAVCHGPELQGVIGPNLVDEYWMYGKGRIVDVVATVRAGVVEKGMPSWEGQLKNDELRAVAVYIIKNRGRLGPNPKPPQGEKIVGE